MYKKNLFMASALSLLLIGCGSGETSLADLVKSEVNPSKTNSFIVTVSDGYILNAECSIGGTLADVELGNGQYEWINDVDLTQPIICTGGYNDLNGNGIIDSKDELAPLIKAPAGYSNINPFTHMVAEGMDGDILKNQLGVDSLDFDVVAMAQSNTLMAQYAAAYVLVVYEMNDIPYDSTTAGVNTRATVIEKLNTGYSIESILPHYKESIEDIYAKNKESIEIQGMSAFQEEIADGINILKGTVPEFIYSGTGSIYSGSGTTESSTDLSQSTPARPGTEENDQTIPTNLGLLPDATDCLPGQVCFGLEGAQTTPTNPEDDECNFWEACFSEASSTSTSSGQFDCLPGQDCFGLESGQTTPIKPGEDE